MTRSLALVAPLILLASMSASGGTWAVYEGERYVLRTDVEPERARALLRLLEAHFDTLRDLLGREPDHEGRLPVRLFASRDDYRRTLGNTAGGIYTYRDRTANAWVQARRYWTRHLLLHEATHQYVSLAFAGNRALLPWWIDEGLAEYAAFHVWDGMSLRCPDLDVISIQDYPRTAREITADPAWHVETTFSGGVSGNRAEAWLLVHHLLSEPRTRKRFLALLAALPKKVHVEDGEKVVREARALFRRLVTSRLDRLTEELREHAREVELTWNVVTIAWDRRGDSVIGRATTTGVLAHRRHVEAAEAEISFRYRVLGGRKGWVGFAHRIVDKSAFRVVTLTTPRSVLWNELGGGRWTRHGAAGSAVTGGDAWHEVSVRFGGDAVTVTVDGIALPPLARKDPGPLGTIGLFVDGAEAEFRDFAVR